MNILLTGCFDYSKIQLEQLESLGHKIYFMQYESDSLPVEPPEIDATVCNGLFLHHNIDQFSNLKFIQLTSAGFDRVPVEIIKSRGIQLFNARGVYSIPMAEWALFRVLEFYKFGWTFKTQQENKQWTKNRRLREIFGSEVAVIGAGNVGQEVAKRFQALGAETTGFDVHTNNTLGFSNMALIESLYDKIGDFDIVILTAPLLPSTRGLFDRRILERMKKGSIIVNIARGALIDERALIDVLSERKDFFVALDVFEDEPLNTDSKLWEMDYVAISPHNSFVGDGNNYRMFNVIYNNLKAFVKKQYDSNH